MPADTKKAIFFALFFHFWRGTNTGCTTIYGTKPSSETINKRGRLLLPWNKPRRWLFPAPGWSQDETDGINRWGPARAQRRCLPAVGQQWIFNSTARSFTLFSSQTGDSPVFFWKLMGIWLAFCETSWSAMHHHFCATVTRAGELPALLQAASFPALGESPGER